MTTAIDSTTRPRCQFSRRQALALSGAVAVTGLPTLALAAADPDLEPIGLGRQYQSLADAKIDAKAHLEALRAVYHDQRPTIPEGLRDLGFDRWRADCDRMSDEIGFTAAQANVDRLDAALWSIRADIAKIPVAGYAGLKVKAMIMAEQIGTKGRVDPAIADSVLVDLGGRANG